MHTIRQRTNDEGVPCWQVTFYSRGSVYLVAETKTPEEAGTIASWLNGGPILESRIQDVTWIGE